MVFYLKESRRRCASGFCQLLVQHSRSLRPFQCPSKISNGRTRQVDARRESGSYQKGISLSAKTSKSASFGGFGADFGAACGSSFVAACLDSDCGEE